MYDNILDNNNYINIIYDNNILGNVLLIDRGVDFTPKLGPSPRIALWCKLFIMLHTIKQLIWSTIYNIIYVYEVINAYNII